MEIKSSKYDYLIVGAGPFGATFARIATDHGKKCLVIDRREHIAGNMYTKNIQRVDVHMYGPHIFHTENERVWDFVNQFGTWMPLRFCPRVRYGDRTFSFPINLLTLHQLWGVNTPEEARQKLESVRVPCEHPKNAEQFLLAQVGPEIYEIFFKGYTQKQWFMHPKDLPASIVARIPIRLTYNDAYFRDRYQAIPRGGYTGVVDRMLDGIDVELGVDFATVKNKWKNYANHLIYTGPIDQYFDYQFGRLEYRSIRFEMEIHQGDYQGHSVINYPAADIPYTRIVEHKHFVDQGPKHIGNDKKNPTVITKDFPIAPDSREAQNDPYYPVRDEKNSAVYEQYRGLAKNCGDILFGGRLGEYKYYDMDQVIASAMTKAQRLVQGAEDATSISAAS